MDIFEQIKSLAGDWLKRKDANEKLTRMLEMIAEASHINDFKCFTPARGEEEITPEFQAKSDAEVEITE